MNRGGNLAATGETRDNRGGANQPTAFYFPGELRMDRILRWAFIAFFGTLTVNTTQTLAESPSGASAPTVKLKTARSSEGPLLTIGSKAPPLDIEFWLNPPTGAPKNLKVNFEPDHVVVVEFWATWCGPCISSMPHIADLQKQYAGKKVSIVSISAEDQATIDTFLAQNVPLDLLQQIEPPADIAPITFRKLTSGYRITSDTDQSSQRDYMEASAQDGIPTAFIVGKSGLIEWIGHPAELDDVLKDVVENKWNREAYQQKLEAKKQLQKLQQEVLAALKQKQPNSAKQLIESALASAQDPARVQELKQLQLQVLLFLRDASATELAGDIIDGSKDANVLDGLAWTIYKLNQEKPLSPELVDLAVGSSNKALQLGVDPNKKSLIRDTLAHLLAGKGELEKAIALQKEAIKGATPQMAEQLAPFLQELQAQFNSREKTN
ncbi:MAG: redoxin family protein [Planctomycetota bacterium]|nr:redoxin family protein [Planctomycetota bacterium]MDA1179472.1 redoxin family protein [Planctomycetota bacterium]